MRILVTAGPTCEDLDPVRFLTNRSSGRMGYAIAAAAAARGHEAVLVSGPTALDPPDGATVVPVRSAADMLKNLSEQTAKDDIAATAMGTPAK